MVRQIAILFMARALPICAEINQFLRGTMMIRSIFNGHCNVPAWSRSEVFNFDMCGGGPRSVWDDHGDDERACRSCQKPI